MLNIGDKGKVYVNQANRPYEVAAVLGDRALIEYTMPNGRVYLVETDRNLGAQAPTDYREPGVWKNRAWDKLPRAWQVAVHDAVLERANRRQAFAAAQAERTRLDGLWRRYTGFTSRADCLNAGGAYRPSLCKRDPIMVELADDYDAGQVERGDPRRAYRY